jgi:hypothetical protein
MSGLERQGIMLRVLHHFERRVRQGNADDQGRQLVRILPTFSLLPSSFRLLPFFGAPMLPLVHYYFRWTRLSAVNHISICVQTTSR